MPVLPQIQSRRSVTGGRRFRLGVVAGWLLTAALVVVALGVFALGVGPRFLPYRAYAIKTGSMSPALPVGSEAILRPADAGGLGRGDVIAFHKPNGGTAMVTHRIVRVERLHGRRVFVTKGDANAVPDAWRVRAEGHGWRVVASVPDAGYVVEAFRAPLWRMVALALVLASIGLGVLRRIWARPAIPRDP
jgi:signal peptidase I